MLILLKTGSVKKFDTTVQFFDTRHQLFQLSYPPNSSVIRMPIIRS